MSHPLLIDGEIMISKTLLSVLKPFRLISLVLTYTLGAGLVQYVRRIRTWPGFFQGLIFLLMFTVSLAYLRSMEKLRNVNNWPEGMLLREARQVRLLIAIITGTLLTVSTTIFIGWMLGDILWQGLVFLIIAVVIVGVFYYLSSVIEGLRPYQILFEALLFVVIPPALAFFIQSDDLHRLLTLVVIPLVPAYMAYRLIVLLKRFPQDYKMDTPTVVTLIGWEKTMFLHNALILMTYLLFALVAILGFPWFLIWPVFLSLPIGLMEVWLMERVRRGGKPMWRVMQFATAFVLFLPIYLIGIAFWIR